MTAGNMIALLGGLGAFLFGMKYMGDGLELAAGARMKDLLETLTRNRFLGFLLGVFVTVVIQSSSATTVMVMGFINAGIMDLVQATGVIFGANIGTTITSVLIALDASAIAPACLFVGAFLMLYSGKARHKHVGQVILGFGLLFQGLSTMSAAMKGLKDLLWFQNFILNAKNPLLGLAVGTVLCAVIQSSSAAVGILQALAMQGMMPLYFASFLICGINIGSAMPAILASLNARNNARRASLIYLIYNVVGAVLMTVVTLTVPYTDFIARLIPDPAFQVSVIHILFKVAAAVVLLPCTNLVVKLTYRLIPKQVHEDGARLEYLDVNLEGAPGATLLQIRSEVDRMAGLVRENIIMGMEDVTSHRTDNARQIRDNEEVIDFLTDAISDFLVKFNVQAISDQDARYVNHVFRALSDLERIGDYAEILMKLTERSKDENLLYSESARKELTEIYGQALALYDRATEKFHDQNTTAEELETLTAMEKSIRRMTSASQSAHMERLREGQCSAEAGIVFGELLNCLNRIGGHAINIAEAATEA